MLRGRVVTADGVIPDGVLSASGGRIGFVGPAPSWPDRATLPPASGLVLLPGLVDVHCHGGGGRDVGELPGAGGAQAPDGPAAVVAHHRAHGTTTQLASLVSAPERVLLRQLDALASLVEEGRLAGVHLEGPFLSPGHAGAHEPSALRRGDPALLEALLTAGRGAVRSMTLAVEVPGVAALVPLLREHGVLPSLGHTGAPSGLVREVLAEGGWSVTHLFNGMPPWHHRDPGPVAACLAAAARGDAVLELVADGVHLADGTVAAVLDLVGPGQVALVTDAMAAAGSADGSYRLGGRDVVVRDGVARLARTSDAGTRMSGAGALAGGTARLLDVVRRVVQHAGVSLPDAVTAAASTPAALLGLHDRGALAVGRRADVLVVDDDLRLLDVHAAAETA